ncbi:MAG: pyridoxal phosphate-dependent aminotransferase [Treponema sp.]|jgi:aminotransferase/cystathionine beta-lyase|nr:pyridoxal phosphate-dependent aminotransferase [Treponema sp.]
MYDFTSVVERDGMGSAKWKEMHEKNPHVPKGIVPFSVADMEFRMAPEIISGLGEYLKDLVMGYTFPTDAYYDAVCGWMKKRHRWDIQREWIVLSDGVVSAFFNAVKSVSEPGEGIIIMPPVYYPFFMAMERNKRRIVSNNLVIDNGRYVVDYDDLEAKARDPRNKALLFCSPHNPVGRVWERDELEKIGKICLENNVVVISDEIHSDLIMPGFSHQVFAQLNDDFAQNTITCTAPSKTFNLAGMATSNTIIQNKKLKEAYVETLMQNIGVSMLNIFGYKTCEIAYTQCENWLHELLIVLNQNRKTVENFIKERIPQIKVFNLEGTYLQWWDCRGLGMDYKALERLLIEDAFLFLDEGHIFGENGKGFERINLAAPEKTLKDGLERFAAALKKKNII